MKQGLTFTPKIILVDDDPLEAQLVSHGFKKVGIQADFIYFDSGKRFLEFVEEDGAQTKEVSLVLLDLKMPLMNGKEVLSACQSRSLPKLPIVVFTSSSHPVDINDCYSLGASAFVTKPINREEYLDSLKKIADFWVGINQRMSK